MHSSVLSTQQTKCLYILKNWCTKNYHFLEQRCGSSSLAAACSVGILSKYLFQTGLLSFKSSTLLIPTMDLGKQDRIIPMPGLQLSTCETQKGSRFLDSASLSHSCCSHSRMNLDMKGLSTSPFIQRNKSLKKIKNLPHFHLSSGCNANMFHKISKSNRKSPQQHMSYATGFVTRITA